MNGHGPPSGQVYVNGHSGHNGHNGHNGHTGHNGTNGHVGDVGLVNKGLSESKVSLNSLKSSNGSTLNGKAGGLGNGYAGSMQSLQDDFEENVVQLVMEPKDRRFGFSVFGGVDQEGPPQIDNISPGEL